MYVMFLLFYKKCTIVTDFQFRSDCSNSNSDFNSTQSYLLIEHQELLILPFHITSSMRVYVTEDEDEEDDASKTSSVTPSPLILLVDDKKPPNRPLRRDFNQKIASKLSEAKALMTGLECRTEREVRRYASRWKIQNTIMKTHHFPF